MIAGYETHEAIEAVMNWSQDQEQFDDSFVKSLSDSYEEYGELTERQEDALANIIMRFHIEISEHI